MKNFSIQKNISIAKLQGTAHPSANYYEAGEFIWKSDPAVGSGKIKIGWSRLITGTAHVLGTDWSNVFVTTT